MTIYVEPPEVVPGQVMSATNWKDWVVDVAKAMWIYTGQGQIAVASSSNQLRAMAPGSKATVLQTNAAGDDVEWSSGVYVALNKAAVQSIPDNALTKVLLDSITGTDPYGFFSAANNRVEIPTGMGGLYDIFAMGYWSSHATAGTMRMMSLAYGAIGGSAYTISETIIPAIAGKDIWQQCALSAPLTAGQFIEFYCHQASGVALNLNLIRLIFEKRR
jgi:hypothetical protein